MSKTLFQKIADREISGDIVYEDDEVLAFRDIRPATPTHVLIVPRKPIPRINEAGPEDQAAPQGAGRAGREHLEVGESVLATGGTGEPVDEVLQPGRAHPAQSPSRSRHPDRGPLACAGLRG